LDHLAWFYYLRSNLIRLPFLFNRKKRFGYINNCLGYGSIMARFKIDKCAELAENSSTKTRVSFHYVFCLIFEAYEFSILKLPMCWSILNPNSPIHDHDPVKGNFWHVCKKKERKLEAMRSKILKTKQMKVRYS
jgi:hypothetical protein